MPASEYLFSFGVALLLGVVIGILFTHGRTMKFHYTWSPRAETVEKLEGGKMQNLRVTVTVQWDPAQFAAIKDFLSDKAELPKVTEQLRTSEQQLKDAVASDSNV